MNITGGFAIELLESAATMQCYLWIMPFILTVCFRSAPQACIWLPVKHTISAALVPFAKPSEDYWSQSKVPETQVTILFSADRCRCENIKWKVSPMTVQWQVSDRSWWKKCALHKTLKLIQVGQFSAQGHKGEVKHLSAMWPVSVLDLLLHQMMSSLLIQPAWCSG